MWVVCDGDDVYVRSVNGRGYSWFRGVQDSHEARIRAGGCLRARWSGSHLKLKPVGEHNHLMFIPRSRRGWHVPLCED